MVFVRFPALLLVFWTFAAFAGEEVLHEPLRRLSELNYHNQGPRCAVAENCNPFLAELTQSDQGKHLGILPSQLESCEALIQDKEFLSSRDLTQYFGAYLFPQLGDFIGSQIQLCSGSGTGNENKRQASLQYYNLARLELGQTATLNEIAEIENILGTDSAKYLQDKKFDCRVSDFESVVSRCEQLKNKCSPHARMDEIIETTKSTLSNIEKSEVMIKEKTRELLAMGLRKRRTSAEGHMLEAEVARLKTLIQLEQQTHPWIMGTAFKEYQKQDLKKAIAEQLKITKKGLQQKFSDISDKSACLTRHDAKCDTSDFREFVEKMPDVPEARNFESADKSKALAAGSYVDYERCLHNAKIDQIKTTDKVISQGGTAIAVGVTLLAPGPWALLVDTAWLGTSGVEAYKACSANVGLEDNRKSNADQTCPETGIRNPSHAVAIHGDCLTAAGYAALSVVPVSAALVKMNRWAEAATITGAERRAESLEAQTRSFEKRSQTSRVIAGPDGQIERTVVPKSVSNIPDGIKIVEVKNSEAKNVLYYQSREKLADGSWVRSSREVQIDPLTGAIDANYPAGRELFEKMAQAKAGKAYVAFVDVGNLGAVNKTFAGGVESGDRYIKAVADKIMAHSNGKITMSRMGGDEFALIIDETDPKKVKALLEAIQKDLRMDFKGEGKLVFREEKIQRAEDYRQTPSEENRQRVKELSQIQQPDISMGSAQVGRDDNLEVLLTRAEDQAKNMKVATALEFGRSAQKYGSSATPRSRAHPRYQAEIKEPKESSSWKKATPETNAPSIESLRDVKATRREEVSRFKDTSVARYEDELGNETYRIEKYLHGLGGETKSVSYEIPVRGKTGMLDGTHQESKKLVMDHFKSDAGNVLVMPKLKNLKYINYFQDGSKAGDKMLEAVSKAIKKEVRDEDLSFKLSGADFLMSLKNIKPEKLKAIEERINREVGRNPAVKQVIREEVRHLQIKQKEAIAKGDRDLAEVLQRQIQEASHFKPDLRFQSLSSEEIGNASSFEQAIQSLENKFPKD